VNKLGANMQCIVGAEERFGTSVVDQDDLIDLESAQGPSATNVPSSVRLGDGT
jgi:hypothetical protein